MYSNDEEYRQCLRNIMQMDPTKMYETDEIFVDRNDPNVSAETIDEYTLDMDAMKTFLDGVYGQTRTHEAFQRLYEAAAALMFSTNPEIGLAVLMSYDYMPWFVTCYQEFLRNPAAFDAGGNEWYRKLMDRIAPSAEK